MYKNLPRLALRRNSLNIQPEADTASSGAAPSGVVGLDAILGQTRITRSHSESSTSSNVDDWEKQEAKIDELLENFTPGSPPGRVRYRRHS